MSTTMPKRSKSARSQRCKQGRRTYRATTDLIKHAEEQSKLYEESKRQAEITSDDQMRAVLNENADLRKVIGNLLPHITRKTYVPKLKEKIAVLKIKLKDLSDLKRQAPNFTHLIDNLSSSIQTELDHLEQVRTKQGGD